MIQVHLKKFINECIDQNPTIRNLGSRMDSLEARMDRLEARMDNLEARMDNLEARMDNLEARMDKLEARMDKLEARMDKLEARMERLEEEVHRQGIILESIRDDIKFMLEALTMSLKKSESFEAMGTKVEALDQDAVTTRGILKAHIQNSRIHLPN